MLPLPQLVPSTLDILTSHSISEEDYVQSLERLLEAKVPCPAQHAVQQCPL